ncbi:MAG: hypothetical protein LBL41_01535 [Bifidobacteriaceae bacterium]|jgi:tight adherence protein B|nr:hypothetical protein [Bifidobacteriaceae bacterium]
MLIELVLPIAVLVYIAELPAEAVEKVLEFLKRAVKSVRQGADDESLVLVKVPISQVIAEMNAGASIEKAFADVLGAESLKSAFTLTALQKAFKKYAKLPAMPVSTPFNKSARQKITRKNAQLDEISLAVFVTINYSSKSGIPTTRLLQSILDTLQLEIDAQNDREIAIAGAKQTAKILKMLPIFGIFLGFLLGTNPLAVIFDGRIGSVVALIGVAFYVWGEKWTGRLIDAATGGGE